MKETFGNPNVIRKVQQHVEPWSCFVTFAMTAKQMRCNPRPIFRTEANLGTAAEAAAALAEMAGPSGLPPPFSFFLCMARFSPEREN